MQMACGVLLNNEQPPAFGGFFPRLRVRRDGPDRDRAEAREGFLDETSMFDRSGGRDHASRRRIMTIEIGEDGGAVEAATAGHDVVMSPNSHLYLDHGQAKGTGEPEVIGGYLPLNMVYQYEPVPPQLRAEMQKHILGAQGNLWSEYFYAPTLEKVEYQDSPRAAGCL